MPLLIDSGFLYALFDKDDRFHHAVATVAELEGGVAVVPDVVLVEVAFLVRRAGGVPAVVRFLESFAQSGFELEALTHDDVDRARSLMETYADARLDFVDVCIMAIAARLGITRIATIDPRDFLIVRPTHVGHFEIVPPAG
jgi:predicted nucleic acid-binding protein